MPAKPAWISRLPAILHELESLTHPFVDRATLEVILNVRRRRAQQIMAPCVSYTAGSTGLADRAALIAHLRRIANDDDASFEVERRRRVGKRLQEYGRELIENPRVMVEAPVRILSQRFASLPAGVTVEPGRITVEFAEPQQGLEKLLALAMAIGNDMEGFEKKASNVSGLAEPFAKSSYNITTKCKPE